MYKFNKYYILTIKSEIELNISFISKIEVYFLKPEDILLYFDTVDEKGFICSLFYLFTWIIIWKINKNKKDELNRKLNEYNQN